MKNGIDTRFVIGCSYSGFVNYLSLSLERTYLRLICLFTLFTHSCVAAYLQPGARQAAVATRFGVRASFFKKLLRHECQTGSLALKPASSGRARYLDATAQSWLVAYVQRHP